MSSPVAPRIDIICGVTMKALSPLADFSYDYHHLAFAPVDE